MYFYIAYMLLRHRPTNKSFVVRFTKLTQVFNSHFLMVLVLTTCNTFLGWNFMTSSLNFTELAWASENFAEQPSEVHPRIKSPILVHPICMCSSVPIDKTTSQFFHSSPVDQMRSQEVYFWSFVTKPNEACTKHAPKYIQQFPWYCHTLRVSHNFP